MFTAQANNATFQWLDCANGNMAISGETNAAFTPTINGNYAVEVAQNGCSDTSLCFVVANISVLENAAIKSVLIYPNPNNGQFIVELKSASETEITVCEMSGKVILKQTVTSKREVPIQIEGTAGIYFVTVKTGNQTEIFKVQKLQ